MTPEAEPPRTANAQQSPGRRLLTWLLVWLLLVLGGTMISIAIETHRHRQQQSPQTQREEWRRVQQQGQAIASLLKAGTVRKAREVDQLLDIYWAQQLVLYTPAALQVAAQDSNDLLRAADLLRQAEVYETLLAGYLVDAQHADERWRLYEHGLAPSAVGSATALAMASAASGGAVRVIQEPGLNPRRLVWVNEQLARRYRLQATQAMNRVVYRYAPATL